MKIEKPPILDKGELTKINDAMPVEAKYGDVFLAIAKAQRDADLAYSEPLIQQARRESYDEGYAKAVRDNQELIGTREVFWQNEIQQAKAEVAREIFEEIRKVDNHQIGERWDRFELCRQKALTLESKYTGEQK